MPDDPTPRPATRAAQGGGHLDAATGALVPPLHPSTSYGRDAEGRYLGGRSYTRDHNPTYDAAEQLLADLEGGADALLFASGMAAGTTVFEALEPGAHVVAPDDMYWTLRAWMARLAQLGRIELELVPTGDLDALRAALRPGRTRLVWLESPSNPMTVVTDLAAAAELAHGAGALAVADSTTATPVLTQPLALGCDLVLHSATKQLNGHGDVLAGALVTAREDALWERIRFERGTRGAVPGPFEAWLLLRGMRTLYLRVTHSAQGAQRVAEFLRGRRAVRAVLYPGLPEHPGLTLVENKIDRTHGQPATGHTGRYPHISLSLKTGAGMDLLRQHLLQLMAYSGSGEGEFMARRRHLDALQRVLNHLHGGRKALMDGHAGELLAEDLRLAQKALGEITGEFTADDLLGEIFSSFCIGK